MDKPVKPETKKPYTKPTLTAYGTVRELTRTTGIHGTRDGGAPGSNRTGI
jgi:hypothetical protein